MAKKISALVLAAGSSERMAQPKMLLPFGDRTILTKTMDAVLDSGAVSETIVVLGEHADSIRPLLDESRVRVVVNSESAAGISSSIRAAVQAASPQTDAFMLILGDHPLLHASTVTQLAEKFQSGNKGICVPAHQGVPGHPVFFDKRYRDELLGLTGDEGARRLLMRNPTDVLDVHVSEVGVVFDVDDEDDYDEALRIAGLPPREKPVEEPPAPAASVAAEPPASTDANENGIPPEEEPRE